MKSQNASCTHRNDATGYMQEPFFYSIRRFILCVSFFFCRLSTDVCTLVELREDSTQRKSLTWLRTRLE